MIVSDIVQGIIVGGVLAYITANLIISSEFKTIQTRVNGWQGTVPQGMTQISSPNHSVLVIGRVFVESDSDLGAAYGPAKHIQLTPLSRRKPGQSHFIGRLV
jgi:hypothetical protein